MKVAQFTSVADGIENNFTVTTGVQLPDLSPESPVLVEVFRASLNPQDFKVAEMPLVGRFVLPAPSTPGTDFAGRVKASIDPAYVPGDIVFGSLQEPVRRGTLAEYVVVPSHCIAKSPASLASESGLTQLACLGTAGLTAQLALREVSPGAHVFINGSSGGTGIYSIQLAKNVCKADHVFVTCSQKNEDLVRTAGADGTIDYHRCNVVEALAEEATRTGRMFDLVIDNVGNNPSLYWQAHRYLAKDGDFIQVGLPTIGVSSVAQLLGKMLWPSVLGGGSRKFSMIIVKTESKLLSEMADHVAEKRVNVPIEATFTLEQVGEAFTLLKSGRARGKLIVVVSSCIKSLEPAE